MASSKLKNAKAGEEEEMSIDMSPMIDMVFLLLIFFLVSASMIIVEMDPDVEPPVASNAQEAKKRLGRIVINIHQDGELFDEKSEVRLNEDEDVFNYVTEQKERVDLQGYEPRLHLRGDKRAVFKHCRRVIRLAAKAGVDQVIFASYSFEPKPN